MTVRYDAFSYIKERPPRMINNASVRNAVNEELQKWIRAEKNNLCETKTLFPKPHQQIIALYSDIP
jgi:hypothetical protein